MKRLDSRGVTWANAVYVAEHEVAAKFGKTLDRSKGEVDREIKRVMRSKRVRAMLPFNGNVLTFEHSPGRGGGWQAGHRIVLADSKSSGLRDYVIVHEIAHYAANKVHVAPGWMKRAGGTHGPRFVTALLRMYRAAYGRERAQALHDELARRDVECVDSNGEVSGLRVGEWIV